MGSANVELVRSLFAGWERGDWSSAEWADPDIEYLVVDGPDPGSWRGLAEVAQRVRDWLGAWQEYREEVEEYRELDDERVLVLIRRGGRGKTSGLDLGRIGTPGAQLFRVRGGRVSRVVTWAARDRAFADRGLAPEGNQPDS